MSLSIWGVLLSGLDDRSSTFSFIRFFLLMMEKQILRLNTELVADLWWHSKCLIAHFYVFLSTWRISFSSNQSSHEWYALISICQRILILLDEIDSIFIVLSTSRVEDSSIMSYLVYYMQILKVAFSFVPPPSECEASIWFWRLHRPSIDLHHIHSKWKGALKKQKFIHTLLPR